MIACLFCLEDVKANEEYINPIGCNCQYKVHGPCLQTWFEEKNQYECPICHAVSIPNPAQLRPIQFVIVERRAGFSEVDMGTQRCLGFCCLSLLLTVLVINIISMSCCPFH